VVRAFVRLREVLSSSRELAAKLDALEQKTEVKHEGPQQRPFSLQQQPRNAR